MRLRILSDLHLEFHEWDAPAADADVVVLAGDIDVGTDGLTWARAQFPALPIVYVPGNHEYYGKRWQSRLASLRQAAADRGIHLLDGDEVILRDVRFLGATLWTDFALGTSEPSAVAEAMELARRRVNDFRVIGHGTDGLLQPEHVRDMHRGQVRWLESRLAQPFAGATVVVTHHLPHPRSIHPRWVGDPLNPSFASDLSRLVGPPVSLWVHGHTHESADYVHNGTRVVCNPAGYRPHEPNAAFDPRLVVGIDAARVTVP
jgi:3',5'-cyclic AMP phosphodiesterase CpdA